MSQVVITKNVAIILVLVALLVGAYVKGRFDGSATKERLKIAQEDALVIEKNTKTAVVAVEKDTEQRVIRDTFFDKADKVVEEFYQARAKAPSVEKDDEEANPIVDDSAVVFDADELRLFNLGNSPEAFDARGPFPVDAEVPRVTPGR